MIKKENLYCLWDPALQGQKGLLADDVATIQEMLDSGDKLVEIQPSNDPHHPFKSDKNYRFAYLVGDNTWKDFKVGDVVRFQYAQQMVVAIDERETTCCHIMLSASNWIMDSRLKEVER